MGPPHEGSIRRPIAHERTLLPWSYVPLLNWKNWRKPSSMKGDVHDTTVSTATVLTSSSSSRICCQHQARRLVCSEPISRIRWPSWSLPAPAARACSLPPRTPWACSLPPSTCSMPPRAPRACSLPPRPPRACSNSCEATTISVCITSIAFCGSNDWKRELCAH